MHGNQIVTDAEVLKIAGVAIGVPFTTRRLPRSTTRLKDSGKFESIDVLKRFASIEDASKIIVVIIVNEGPVRIVSCPGDRGGRAAGQEAELLRNLMFVPVLEGQDGYGLTYGARVAYPKVIGPNSRLSFPMTWGGTASGSASSWRRRSRAGRSAASSSAARCSGGAIRRTTRTTTGSGCGRGRRRCSGIVRAGGTVGWQQVSFAGAEDDFGSIGADVTLDTRLRIPCCRATRCW